MLNPENMDQRFVNKVQLIMKKKRILNYIKEIVEFNITISNID